MVEPVGVHSVSAESIQSLLESGWRIRQRYERDFLPPLHPLKVALNLCQPSRNDVLLFHLLCWPKRGQSDTSKWSLHDVRFCPMGQGPSVAFTPTARYINPDFILESREMTTSWVRRPSEWLEADFDQVAFMTWLLLPPLLQGP